MTEHPFLIAGGGIAGLAAALGLARAGHGARLFEQAPAFEEVGAGLQMSPNGVRALQYLGAWEAVEPACVIPSEIHVRDAISGAILQRIRLGKPFEQRFGAPYRVCHRADLLAGLLATARARDGIELNTAHRVLTAKAMPVGVTLQFDDGAPVTGRAVIAADGIRSTLRRLVCGESAPVDRGHVIYRALIPLRALPPDIEADCVTLWLYPGGHVVHYPVSNWDNFNIVAAIDGSAADGGWAAPADAADVARVFAPACDALAGLIAVPRKWLRWKAADVPELPRWSKDGILLVGDAAHATLPYLAQGAVMALEDACVLSRRTQAEHDIAAAFAGFEQDRRGRTRHIQSQSRRQGKIYHAAGLVALARNSMLRLGGGGLALRQTAWIYDWTP